MVEKRNEWKTVHEEFFMDAFGRPAVIALMVSDMDKGRRYGARMLYRDNRVNVSLRDIPSIIEALQKIYDKFKEIEKAV